MKLDKVKEIDDDTRRWMLWEYLKYYREGLYYQRKTFTKISMQLPFEFRCLARFSYNLQQSEVKLRPDEELKYVETLVREGFARVLGKK